MTTVVTVARRRPRPALRRRRLRLWSGGLPRTCHRPCSADSPSAGSRHRRWTPS